MTAHKHILELDSTGGTTVSDTGRAFGSIDQVRWIPDSDDTGQVATLTLQLQQKSGSDTGLSHNIWSEGSLNLGSDIHRLPRQPAHDPAGANLDTGGLKHEPVYSAGDLLRAKVIPADTGVVIAGELHVITGVRGGLPQI